MRSLSNVTGLECLAVLKALGEPSRVRIMGLLLKGPHAVNAISERLGLSQYNVSRHLRVLRNAGLVEARKDAQRRLYGVAPNLRAHMTADGPVLDLDWCTFRFNRLLKEAGGQRQPPRGGHTPRQPG